MLVPSHESSLHDLRLTIRETSGESMSCGWYTGFPWGDCAEVYWDGPCIYLKRVIRGFAKLQPAVHSVAVTKTSELAAKRV